jgi:hypothetical protein
MVVLVLGVMCTRVGYVIENLRMWVWTVKKYNIILGFFTSKKLS